MENMSVDANKHNISGLVRMCASVRIVSPTLQQLTIDDGDDRCSVSEHEQCVGSSVARGGTRRKTS